MDRKTTRQTYRHYSTSDRRKKRSLAACYLLSEVSARSQLELLRDLVSVSNQLVDLFCRQLLPCALLHLSPDRDEATRCCRLWLSCVTMSRELDRLHTHGEKGCQEAAARQGEYLRSVRKRCSKGISKGSIQPKARLGAWQDPKFQAALHEGQELGLRRRAGR